MKMVYTHEHRFLVCNVQNILTHYGIPSQLKNEYAAGGVWELSVFDAWPQLWIVNDADYDKACELVKNSQKTPSVSDWLCAQCGEHNDASFEFCWQCEHASDNPST